MRSQIELIGVCGEILAPYQAQLLASSSLIAAAKRHLHLVEGLGPPIIPLTPLAAMMDAVEAALTHGAAAILASGDPLFFGIGRNLITRFGPEALRVHPALSAAQLACARFKVAWDDLHIFSLHGRSGQELAARILGAQRTLLFTDAIHTPARIAKTLIQALTDCGDTERLASIHMRVGEDLDLSTERLSSGSLREIAGRDFSPLNLVLVEQPAYVGPAFSFGLKESEIQHSRGLITKDEIRAAALHRLRLPAEGVLWDIGGGSGSVSLEAARLQPRLSIHVVEKNPLEQANIRANIRRFAAYGIHLHCAEAPAALAALPDPDRIFIGGGGPNLAAIIQAVVPRLRPGGLMVVSTVLASSKQTALRSLAAYPMRVECSAISVSRQFFPGGEQYRLNPITLITGIA